MTEVAYLPLKSGGGAILGHARIADGICRLRFRRPVSGQAVVLGEDGTWFGMADEEIGVRGRLCAVAVLSEGELLCCGIPQGQKMSFSELKRRLTNTAERNTAKSLFKESLPERRAAFAPEKDLVPQEQPPLAMETAATVTDGEPPIAVRSFVPAPLTPSPAAEPSVPKEALIPQEPVRKEPVIKEPDDKESIMGKNIVESSILQEPAMPIEEPHTARKDVFAPAAAVWDTEAAEVPWIDPFTQERRHDLQAPAETEAQPMPREEIRLFESEAEKKEAQSLADSAADSEAFAALLRRAELVFESIESPAPPLLSGGKRSTARETEATVARDAAISDVRPVRTPAGTAAQRSWGQEVDLLLGSRPAETRTPIENPFPHIFPDAVFVRIGGSGVRQHLEGEWISGGERMRILAVPCAYSPHPPADLVGYTRFIRTLQGSFWVRVMGER